MKIDPIQPVKTSSLKHLFWAISMLALALLTTAASLPAKPAPETTSQSLPIITNNQPYYHSDAWHLDATTVGSISTKHLFSESVDLIEISYGKNKLWAAVGITNPDGSYETWVEGSLNPHELRNEFSKPRRIVLRVPGTPESVDQSWCQAALSGRCHLTRIVEALQPGLLLDGDKDFTYGLSNVFVRTGIFPSRYQNGVLTWTIELDGW